jgi:pyruvate dehydrogenase E2 component (dihydrolipoamide acetyltransferase)
MALEFKLPELGENIDSIRVVRVLVTAGESVAADQTVLELETDKATIEVPSTVAGTVSTVQVQPGDMITSGQLIFSLAGTGEVKPAAAETKPETKAKPAALSEQAAKAEPAPAQAEGPSPSVPTPAAAKTEPAAAAAEGPAPSAPAPAAAPNRPSAENVPAAPSVRRFARELGLALGAVPGSGEHGRVSKDDVLRFAQQANETRPTPTAAAGGAPLPPLPDFSRWGEVERKPMSLIRFKTAEHVALGWSQVPHVTIHDQADITELEPLRKQYAGLAEQEGGKLSMAVMVCKIAAHALRKFPAFNASVDMGAKEIVYKRHVHLGIAVSTPRGLVVPVVRDADTKNMVALAVEIQSLASKCREGKIRLEEIEGSTFTVTNLGRVCGTYFTPIVNYPEVAILGLGRAYEEPAVMNGKIVTRMVLPLSLAFDHRVIDGADGAAFMGWIKEAIRQPLMLSLNG